MDRAIQAPQARNSPSPAQRCASTRMAIRKPITGPSRRASAPASEAGIAPAAMRMTAAGTAAIASGQPRGLITAQASTASSAITETVSATAAFSAILPESICGDVTIGAQLPVLAATNAGNPSGLTMDRLPATLVA
jgi:hypothetical protein